ncbi:MAG: hypothetical protein AAF680_12540, partial [Pseudomonadota bacterium]
MGKLVSIAAAIFLFTCSITTHSAVLRVYPGQSIQAVIDAAQPGDSVIVEPGDYMESGNGLYG